MATFQTDLIGLAVKFLQDNIDASSVSDFYAHSPKIETNDPFGVVYIDNTSLDVEEQSGGGDETIDLMVRVSIPLGENKDSVRMEKTTTMYNSSEDVLNAVRLETFYQTIRDGLPDPSFRITGSSIAYGPLDFSESSLLFGNVGVTCRRFVT